MFLTQDDIAILTGHQRPKAQIRWLAERGLLYEVNAKGRPVVLCSRIENAGPAKAARPRLELLKNG